MDHLQALYWVCLVVRLVFWLWARRRHKDPSRFATKI
jgi:hypothetical protein